MNAARTMFRITCFAVFVLAIVEIAWMGHARSAESAPAGEVALAERPQSGKAGEEAKAPEALAERSQGGKAAESESVAQELETKRAALEERERGLQERESRIKDAQKELEAKIKEMEHLRQVVSGELDEQRKNNEERVNKLVAVFETMTPKSTAAVFETLDDWLAVDVLKKMDIKKVAKVMNIMEKTRSAKLSEMMTGYYHADTDRKISSVKPASGQATPVAQEPARTVAQAPSAPAAAAPVSSPSPRKSTKKGGEQ